MQKYSIKVFYDRKKTAKKTGEGNIELKIYFSDTERKFVSIGKCTPAEWENNQKSKEIQERVVSFSTIIDCMITLNEPLTIENLNKHLGVEVKKAEEKQRKNLNFISWIRDNMANEKLRDSTMRQRMVTLEALMEFGKIKLFSDLTPENLYAWDDWLRASGNRTDVTVFNYHKRLHPYVRKAYQLGILERDPYSRCKFNRGRCKERKPLNEVELQKVRDLQLPDKLDRARDLFVFSAYTGLAYCDIMEFNFEKMTELHDGIYYIDGERLKTGSSFFTPILPPAMEILKKYDFKLPRITNQKGNDYLHLVEERAELNKPMTFHVARHSFATLALAYDTPIDKVARMMGHKNIKTTQIYAKILKSTVAQHGSSLAKMIK